MKEFKPTKVEMNVVSDRNKNTVKTFISKEAKYKTINLSLKNEQGEILAKLVFAIITKPIYCAYVHDLSVYVKNKGIGRRVMEEIDKQIGKRGIPAILINSTYADMENHKSTHDMYQRYGWKNLETHGEWLYLSHKDLNDEEIHKLRQVAEILK